MQQVDGEAHQLAIALEMQGRVVVGEQAQFGGPHGLGGERGIQQQPGKGPFHETVSRALRFSVAGAASFDAVEHHGAQVDRS